MAPASLNRPTNPLLTGSDNAGSPERHSGSDASARRTASSVPDRCMTGQISILRPTADERRSMFALSSRTAGASPRLPMASNRIRARPKIMGRHLINHQLRSGINLTCVGATRDCAYLRRPLTRVIGSSNLLLERRQKVIPKWSCRRLGSGPNL
jgi:hypothetical protein